MSGKKSNYRMDEIQLKQRLIHFQSEAAKYKQLAEKYEKLLKTKAIDIPKPEPEIIEVPIEKEECTAFFNYSIITDSEPTEESSPYIFGNFTMINTGTKTLHDPIICLKTDEPTLIKIGGKIGELDDVDKLISDSIQQWQYVHKNYKQHWLEKGELWLKPKNKLEIAPSQKLLFSSLDITFTNKSSAKPMKIDAFCYFQEIKEGQKSLNSISITMS